MILDLKRLLPPCHASGGFSLMMSTIIRVVAEHQGCRYVARPVGNPVPCSLCVFPLWIMRFV
jgi:hypothetical protein